MGKARQTRPSAKRKPSKTLKKLNPGLLVTKDTNVLDVLSMHPKAAEILEAYGLHCHGCAFGSVDSIEAGAYSHGLSEHDIENIVQDLQDLLDNAPKRPMEMTLTEDAARALLEIARSEGKEECMLRVTTDEDGGYCMEFADTQRSGEREFKAENVAGAMLVAEDLILFRIGGSTVDYREGRFKLDLPSPCACTDRTSCHCTASHK